MCLKNFQRDSVANAIRGVDSIIIGPAYIDPLFISCICSYFQNFARYARYARMSSICYNLLLTPYLSLLLLPVVYTFQHAFHLIIIYFVSSEFRMSNFSRASRKYLY